jgi:hypothetical protein
LYGFFWSKLSGTNEMGTVKIGSGH